MFVNEQSAKFVHKTKYLGVFPCASEKFNILYSEPRDEFYKSLNSILSRSTKRFDEFFELTRIISHINSIDLKVLRVFCI